MIAFNNKENTLAAYYYLGKAYEGLIIISKQLKFYKSRFSLYKN